MRHNDAPFRQLGIILLHGLSDIPIRQPMKPVTPHAFVGNRLRNGIVRILRLVVRMKSRIETSICGTNGQIARNNAHRRKMMRLMQQRQRNKLLQFVEDMRRNKCRFKELRAAMHKTMRNADNLPPGLKAFDPIDDPANAPFLSFVRRQANLELRVRPVAGNDKDGIASDARYASRRQTRQVVGTPEKLELELDDPALRIRMVFISTDHPYALERQARPSAGQKTRPQIVGAAGQDDRHFRARDDAPPNPPCSRR